MAPPVTPAVPNIFNPSVGPLSDGLDIFPVVLDLSPTALLILTILTGIFIAAVSVVLVYHWRRFPFEHETFRTAERVYFAGTFVFLAVAVIGILIS
jgi:hypothetical protein